MKSQKWSVKEHISIIQRHMFCIFQRIPAHVEFTYYLRMTAVLAETMEPVFVKKGIHFGIKICVNASEIQTNCLYECRPAAHETLLKRGDRRHEDSLS